MSDAAPVISVVLPVYNAGKYLAPALDSILAQSFTNFELLITDDGSTDNSLAVLRDYEKKDSRIRLTARENRGFVATVNEMIDAARGQWIARMDQDDIALPRRFERQLQWLEQTGADVCGSWIKLFGANDRRVIKYPQSDAAVKTSLLFGPCFAHPAVMMRADKIRALRYDAAREKAEDYDLWERMAAAGWTMTNVPEVLLHYRRHPSQISSVSMGRQLALSQEIRQRGWERVFTSLNLDHAAIGEILKLRAPVAPKADMDSIDRAFAALLQNSEGEARAVIFNQMTRLYFRAAGQCPDIVTRWSKFNRQFGSGWGLKTGLALWLLSLFKIGPDNILFQKLKTSYVRVIRET